MSRLDVDKLHVRYLAGTGPDYPLMPRRYTLTHSDSTGDLYLTIGAEYDQGQISGWYTRVMRDEVLAEWTATPAGPVLVVRCHVSGGFVVGTHSWRYAIFQRELPLVLEAFRHGDRSLYLAHPELDGASIQVRFHAGRPADEREELWGTPADYAGPAQASWSHHEAH